MSYKVVSIRDNGKRKSHGTYESFTHACRKADAVGEWFPDRDVRVKEVGK